MISPNAMEATIDYFLVMLWAWNLDVIPAKMMTDIDKGQINAIWHCYTEAQVFLCWWHVPHAWQDHFITHHFPKLWGILKDWIQLKEDTEFNEQWIHIQKFASLSLIQYFKDHWLPIGPMWSAQTQKGHTIFEFSKTNMLIKACIFQQSCITPIWLAKWCTTDGISFSSWREVESSYGPSHTCIGVWCGSISQSEALMARMGIWRARFGNEMTQRNWGCLSLGSSW